VDEVLRGGRSSVGQSRSWPGSGLWIRDLHRWNCPLIGRSGRPRCGGAGYLATLSAGTWAARR